MELNGLDCQMLRSCDREGGRNRSVDVKLIAILEIVDSDDANKIDLHIVL